MLRLFLYEVRIAILGDHCVQRGFIEGPALDSAGGLDEGGEIGFGNVQSGEPHHRRLLDLRPLVVLLDPVGEVGHPSAQFLLSLRRQLSPPRWQIAALEGEGELVEL